MNKVFVIYEVNPGYWGEDYRFIQGFDRKKDAQKVLEVLESVNIDFNVYKIIKRSYK